MRTFLILSLMLMMAGCIPTLTIQPVWDKEHAVAEPALEGRWISSDGDGLLKVQTQSNDKEYVLDYVSEDGVSHYEGHLVRLGGQLILDLCLKQDAVDKLVEGQAFAAVLPMHFFARLRLEGDKLHFGLLEDEEMERQITAGVVKAQSSKAQDTVILTGPTAELQEALGKLAGADQVWEESLFYRASVLPQPPAGN